MTSEELAAAKETIDATVSEIMSDFTLEDLDIFVPQVKHWYKTALALKADSAKQAASAVDAKMPDGTPATDEFKAELAGLQATPYVGVNGVGGIYNTFPSLTPVTTAAKVKAENDAKELAEANAKALADAQALVDAANAL